MRITVKFTLLIFIIILLFSAGCSELKEKTDSAIDEGKNKIEKKVTEEIDLAIEKAKFKAIEVLYETSNRELNNVIDEIDEKDLDEKEKEELKEALDLIDNQLIKQLDELENELESNETSPEMKKEMKDLLKKIKQDAAAIKKLEDKINEN